MKKLSSEPVWIGHNRETNDSAVYPLSEMSDRHIIGAYHWACKRYTKYHNEAVKGFTSNQNSYTKLYYKLRELELEACKRGIDLITPDIKLIHRDRKFYWKDTLAFPKDYLFDTTCLSAIVVDRIKNISQLS